MHAPIMTTSVFEETQLDSRLRGNDGEGVAVSKSNKGVIPE